MLNTNLKQYKIRKGNLKNDYNTDTMIIIIIVMFLHNLICSIIFHIF